MNEIEYKIGVMPAMPQLMKLYKDAEWTVYTADEALLEVAFQNSLFVLTAWHNEQLIGALRAVGDNATIVFVQDVIVLKQYHRQGVGKSMLDLFLEYFKTVRQIVLMTDNQYETVSFYSNCGWLKTEVFQLQTFIKPL